MATKEISVVFSKPELKELFITELIRGKYQPRREFDQAALHELAETIKRDGILQYLLVRPIPEQKNLYEIIAGERRWRAAQLAGLEKVPCLVSQYTNEAAGRIALIENTARKNLSPIEEAEGIARLIDEFDYTHEEVASILGKPRTEVTNLLRLLKLDKRVLTLISNGYLTESHGKILAGIPQSKQYVYAESAYVKRWSTRVLENAINKKNTSNDKQLKTAAVTLDANTQRLQRQLSEQLGAPVRFNFDNKNQQQGYVTIRFNSFEEIEGILERVGYRDE